MLKYPGDFSFGPCWLTAADFNGDKKVDIATPNNISFKLDIYLNTCN